MTMMPTIRDELVEGLLSVLGSKVNTIILYGSTAKGTATAESDVDIAILVNSTLDTEEDDRLNDFIVDMNLKYDTVFSVIDLTEADFKKWGNVVPFYKNVADEGIVLWKTA